MVTSFFDFGQRHAVSVLIHKHKLTSLAVDLLKILSRKSSTFPIKVSGDSNTEAYIAWTVILEPVTPDQEVYVVSQHIGNGASVMLAESGWPPM